MKSTSSRRAKIKYVIVRFEHALAWQILEQQGVRHGELGTFNRIKFAVENSPEILDRDYISLRGTDVVCNFFVDTQYFDSNRERDEFIDKLNEGLRQLFSKLNGGNCNEDHYKDLNVIGEIQEYS